MKTLLASVGAMISFSLAIWSLAWGAADLGTTSARLAMQRWEKERATVLPADWEAADERLRWARRVNPREATFSLDLGRLHEWQSLQAPMTSEYSRAYRRQAIGYYAEALTKRPAWGYAWAVLSKNQIMLNGLTPGAEAALVRAIRLGPFDTDVQELVIWLGLALWGQLSSELKTEVENTVARAVAINHDIKLIVGIAIQFDWTDRLRPLLKDAGHRQLLELALKRAN